MSNNLVIFCNKIFFKYVQGDDKHFCLIRPESHFMREEYIENTKMKIVEMGINYDNLNTIDFGQILSQIK